LFLAYRTNGRAYANMLQCCVSLCTDCTECIVAKLRVLEQKLLLQAYSKSYEKLIGTKINDLDLFRGRLRASDTWTIASHSPLKLNISETVRVEPWFQWTIIRKWPIGNQMVTWPRKVKRVIPIRLESNIVKTAGYAI